MKRLINLTCLLIVLLGCNHKPEHETVPTAQKDTVVVVVRDTVVMFPPVVSPPPPPVVKQDTPKPPVLRKPRPKPALAEGDTTRYYYEIGKLSVLITPWNNGKRSILFYDPKGALTYQQNDVRLSYTVTTQLQFRKNGSVEKADIHENPGASRYWYQAVITFSDSNEPEWQTSQQMPVESLADRSNSYYWDKKAGKWIKQEAQP